MLVGLCIGLAGDADEILWHEDVEALDEEAVEGQRDADEERWDNLEEQVCAADMDESRDTTVVEATGEDAGRDPAIIEAMDAVAELLMNGDAAAPYCDESVGAGMDSPPVGLASAFTISPLGYVKNAGGVTIGLVGRKWPGDTHTIANAHQLRTCSASVGIARQDVPNDLIARWLSMGVADPVCATGVERDANAASHVEMWKGMLAEWRAHGAN